MQCLFGDTLKYNGACKPKKNCITNLMYAPVCGWDNKTYSNPSVLACAKMTKKSDGACA